LPPFDNTIKDFYISEDSILNNGEETQVKAVYEDETSYLQTTNERYVIGYD
jgi:hypothetical protein